MPIGSPRDPRDLPGRNGLLIHTVTAALSPGSGVIALGIHAGTPYPDCSDRFVIAMQALLDVYSSGTLRLDAPFVLWQKRDVWSYARELGVPLELTYSCELGLEQPCGRCESCEDVSMLNARA